MSVIGFIPCLPPGEHPGMDAVAHGLAAALGRAGARLRVFPADLRGGRAATATGQARAIESALAQGVGALVLFVLDMCEPEAAVATALGRHVPVVTIHKPTYPVSASVVVPNYHQGVVLAQALARTVLERREQRERREGHERRERRELRDPPRVAILGGPDILDDVELVRGAVDGVRSSRLTLVNDPFLPEYRNLDDVRGRARIAAERLLTDHYPFEGWVVFNDESLVDALAALDGRDLAGQVPTVSRNGSPHAIAELRRGRATATFDYHLPEIGVLAGGTVLDVLGGKLAPGALIGAPFGELFTADNAERYVAWSERVPHGPLDVSPGR